MTRPYTKDCIERADGEIDIDFYVRQAKRLRAEATAEMLGRLIDRLKLGRGKRNRQLQMRVNFNH